MNKKPSVSVIIAHYNGRNLIKGCLDSLLKIDYPKDKLEIIVVDNCSEDTSVRFIKRNYSKVKLIKNDVNNYCKACNLGIAASKGAYVVLLNNDVEVRKNWLSELVKVIEKDKSIGALTSKLIGKDGTIQNAGHFEIPNFYWDERGAGKEAKAYNVKSEVDSISGACVLYRKKTLDKAGVLDEDFVMFGEDVDMSIRIRQQGYKLLYVPSSVAFHKLHGSCSASFARESIEKNRLLLVAKHYPYKLGKALIGSGYFIANKDNPKTGRFLDLMPAVISKLVKHHDKYVAEQAMKDLFLELKIVLNYENKKLEEDVKNIFTDLTETRKDRDHSKKEEQRYRKEVLEKQQEIEQLFKELNGLSQRLAVHKKEIADFANKLKNSLAEAARRESAIADLTHKLKESRNLNSEKERQIRRFSGQLKNLQQELVNHKGALDNLNRKLKETLDSNLAKDASLTEKQRYIDDLSKQSGDFKEKLTSQQGEITGLANKLKDSLDATLNKETVILEKERQIQELSSQLNNLQQDLSSYKERLEITSTRLQESLDSSLAKDATIFESERYIDELSSQVTDLRQELLNYKEAIESINRKLKDSLDISANKETVILEKERQIQELSSQLNNLQQDLSSYKETLDITSRKLQESLDSSLAKDVTITEKTHHIDELYKQLSDLQQKLNLHQEEIANLTVRLQESLDSGLAKDASISEKQQYIDELSSQLNNLQQDLSSYKETLDITSRKLQESLESIAVRDASLTEKEQYIQNLLKQAEDLNQKLQESLASNATKDSDIFDKQKRIEQISEQLASLQQETAHYKEETATLTRKLQESLDSGLAKEAALLDKEQRIQQFSEQLQNLQQEQSYYKEEIFHLTRQLKESLDNVLIKDSIISEKTEELEIAKDKLSHTERELAGIYQSEGFRFVLRPLWAIILHSRSVLHFLVKHISDAIWTAFIIALTPVILLQVSFFACENIAERIFGLISAYFKKERKVAPFNKLSVSLVIPNWNGIDLLKQCLASIYEIDEFKEGKYEVLVVDDASKYNIAKCIKDDFPKVRVIRNFFNQGFGRSCNRGVREAKGELIVLLNNDILVSKDFLVPLKEHFRDENVFAVSPKLYYWDKKTFNYGMHMGRFKEGYLSLWNEAETGNGDKVSQTAPTIFAVGGAKIFRKRDFLWLGGFDDIYRPNCWEDIDISYRAQKRGLKVLYEPKSLVYHKGAATLNYIRHKEIKNELLFMWKNLTDMRMLLSHLNQLPKFFYYGRSSGRLTFLLGYLWAFDHIILALARRFNEKKYIKVSDKKILNRCMLYYRNFKRNNYVHKEKKTVLLITPFMLYPLTSGGKLRIYNFCKRLVQKYDLILLSLIHNEDERKYSERLKEIFKEVHLVHPKTPSNEFLFPQRYKYSFSKFFIEELQAILETTPIDMVHIESNELLYLTRYIKYIPIVYTEHDISILSFFNSYYKKKPHNLFSGFIDYLKLVRYHSLVYGSIDKAIVLSKNDYMTIRAFAPFADVSLVPTGVDLEHFNFSAKSGKKRTLIFVGHYPHYPNEEAAVYFSKYIFPIIKSKMPDVRLKLVGSDPTESVIKLSQIDGIEIIGTVDDVKPYLQEASVFVNAFRRSAGIRGKVLEAMATGTPVVCTRVGASGIDAAGGHSILIADRPSDFANYVVNLLTDDEFYRNIAYNARILVEQKYDWNKIAVQLDAVYQDVTGIKSPVSDEQIEIKIREKSHNQIDTVTMPVPEATPILTKREIIVTDIIEKVDKIVELSVDYRSKNNNLETSSSDPEELHIELTHLCNSKCITCDIWDYHERNNKTVNDELSFVEIRNLIKASQHLKAIKTVVLSGGEPFLRPDLVNICSLIGDILPQASIGILTNATNTETVLSKTKAILGNSKINSLWIGSSLDGIGQAYDRIRGLEGGFGRFLKTVQRFKQELPQISFSATFVLTPFNLDQLVPCWEFADEHRLDFFAQFGVPKPARSPKVFQWREEDFAKINGYISQIIEKMITKNTNTDVFYNSLTTVSDKINLLTKIYYWAHLVDFQRKGKRFSYKCNAGLKFAMFDAYGNMFFCPLLKDKIIGNIREKSFDQIWSSQKAQDTRRYIESGKCSCWLVCTVFPIVSEALSLHGDRVAASLRDEQNLSHAEVGLRGQIREALTIHMDRVDNFLDRKDLLTSISQNIKSNFDLNNEEFINKKCILQSTPQGITLGTNYGCNASCIFCLGGKYRPFSLDLYKNYFEPKLGFILNQSEYVSLCGMGELLLVPEIEKFLDYLNQKLYAKNKILTTNGLALNNRVIERIIRSKYSLQFSLHASNATLHEYLTGIKGGFEQIIKQIRSLAAKRKNRQAPYITLIFVVNTINIEDLPNFVELAATLGADCIQCNYLTIFQPSHIKLSCFFKQEITNQMFEKAQKRADELKINLILPPKFSIGEYSKSVCSDPWKNIYVDTEGAVLPCCYSGEHFGELGKEDVLSIWNNNKFKQIRTDLASGNPLEMCRYCLNSRQDNVNILNAHVSFRPEVQKAILEQN